MSYQNSSHIFGRPTFKFSIRQLLPGRDLLDWSRNKVLFLALGKVSLLVIALTMGLQFGMSSMVSRLDSSITALEDQRHSLVDENIMLRAKRAIAYSPENIEKLAAERLGLHVRQNGQVARYNRATGEFVYN